MKVIFPPAHYSSSKLTLAKIIRPQRRKHFRLSRKCLNRESAFTPKEGKFRSQLLQHSTTAGPSHHQCQVTKRDLFLKIIHCLNTLLRTFISLSIHFCHLSTIFGKTWYIKYVVRIVLYGTEQNRIEYNTIECLYLSYIWNLNNYSSKDSAKRMKMRVNNEVFMKVLLHLSWNVMV